MISSQPLVEATFYYQFSCLFQTGIWQPKTTDSDAEWPLEELEMAVIIKCYLRDIGADGTVIVRGKSNARAPVRPPAFEPQDGDKAFLWTIESPRQAPAEVREPCGQGLAARGNIFSFRRGGNDIRLRLSVDIAAPIQPFTNDDVKRLTSENLPNTDFDLIDKVTEYAQASIIAISDPEAQWLDGLYDPVAIDIANLRHDQTIDETERRTLIDARLGQGLFRARLLRRWDSRCAVTGCRVTPILRASHMRPWRNSNHDEQLNPANGLLLTANLDALFDRFLISFDGDGEMLISHRISEESCQTLGIPQPVRENLTCSEHEFLSYHRDCFRLRQSREQARLKQAPWRSPIWPIKF
jgi:hypothetical protein